MSNKLRECVNKYYMFYEVVTEDINPYIAMAKEMITTLNEAVGQAMSDTLDDTQRKQLIDHILAMRTEVIDRMQVLTGYVDCFVVYEYILNRIQYRFDEKEVLPEDTAFAQEVMNFIFGSNDNVTINDNLRVVLGQLPMRMTRSHYFDLIKNCISVYKGSEIESLEGFLYMFRTSAMLYKHPAQEQYFTEFAGVLQELMEADYEHMDRTLYELYAEKVRVSASKLNDLSDLYMQIGQIINGVYTLVVTEPYCVDEEKMTVVDDVIRGINALFLEKEIDLWQREDLLTEEDRLNWLAEKLPAVEGQQEKLYQSVNVAEAALDELLEGRAEEIEAAGLSDAFIKLHHLSQLNSSSVFAPLESQESAGIVTAEIAEQETEKLLSELKELFQGRSRMFRRAIMAATVEKLPTFFKSAQEIADYMMNALNQCDDEAEKYASKQLILEMIR